MSAAEALIPASDLSEQISTAGKEASGTGNMKLMMNGAVTIGTLDGANVEISQAVGPDNIYLFGMTAEEVAAKYREGTYAPIQFFERNTEIRKALSQMIDGTLFPDNPAMVQILYHDLLFGSGGGKPDNTLCSRTSAPCPSSAPRRQDHQDNEQWLKKAIITPRCPFLFHTDRTIAEYNEKSGN